MNVCKGAIITKTNNDNHKRVYSLPLQIGKNSIEFYTQQVFLFNRLSR